MVNIGVTERIPLPLSRVIGSGVAADTAKRTWDCGLGGLGWMIAASEKVSPYQRSTYPYKKDQFDADKHAGEQSLDGWWLRSQLSFHGGAGIKFMEPAQDDFSDIQFAASANLDVSTAGQVSLVRKPVVQLASAPAVAARLEGGQTTDGSPRYWQIVNGALSRSDGTAITGVTTPTNLEYTGDKVLVGTPTGIDWFDPDDTATDGTIWTQSSGTALQPYWAKNRIFATKGVLLYELPPVTTATALSTVTPLYTHPQAGWQWTGLAETPGTVYMSGYAGLRSSIHAIAVDTQGDTPTLTAAVTAAALPVGEIVYTMYGYGSIVAIGTNKGLRLAAADSGQLQYGPLIFETNGEPVRAITGSGSNIFVGVTNFVDGKSGVVKVDLSTPLADDLGYAYHKYISSGVTGIVDSICFYGATDRLAFNVRGTGVFLQSATVLADSGYLQTGLLRYNVLEKKKFVDALVRFASFSDGSVLVSTIDGNGSETTLLTLAPGSDFADRIRIVAPSTPQEAIALKFTLKPGTSGLVGPVMGGYQVRSLPVVRRSRLIELPLMCFDFEQDRNGVRSGGKNQAFQRLSDLEALEQDSSIVTWKDFRTGEQRQVQIEEIKFLNTEPPDHNYPNYGGFVQVSLRTVD